MLDKLTQLRGSFKGGSRLAEENLKALSARLDSFVAAHESDLPSLNKDFIDVSGLKELAFSAAESELVHQVRKEFNADLFKDVLSRPDYSGRLKPLLTLMSIIGDGFEDVSGPNERSWLDAVGVMFPLSAYNSYANLAGEVPVDSGLQSEGVILLRKIMPALLYALSREELSGIKTEKEELDRERVARIAEGARIISPSLRDLAFSKTRKDLSLTGVKNLYSKTFGEVFATAVVTVPSNSAPTMTYGVEKRAQLLFVLEYCARNLGDAVRLMEEYELLSGKSPLAIGPVIPNPSVFLAILRREMSRLKNIEKAIVESEDKLNNQAFIYYTEAGRTLSRLPLKTRPRMVRFLKEIKQQISKSHLQFRVDEIPAPLREELAQFLTVAK
jgi:hypothetical protein